MNELHYAVGYDGFPLELHQAMVQDQRRVRGFHRALKAVVKPGDVVVDVGAGTGVLSFLAWRCGASRVVALERADIIGTARQTKELNFPDAAIEFHQVDALRGKLPDVRADVLVCELLGNFGLEEDIVPILRRVRSKLLKPGGRIIPSDIELRVAPVQSEQVHKELTGWLERRHDIDFSPFQALAFNRVYHLQDEAYVPLARPAALSTVDLMTVARAPRRMAAELTTTRAGVLHGFVTWFEARLAPGQVLTTGPRGKDTHWGQCYFPVGEPIPVRRGESVRFDLRTVGEMFAREWIWSGAVAPPTEGAAGKSFRLKAVEAL